jgi:low affinity Fe/Cu permease
MKQHSLFNRFAKSAARITGHPFAFFTAVGVVALWALTGPFFRYSDTWQLVINTSTTIITFLMVFLIQNTQNRDSAAIQIKLDELIRSVKGAHNALLNLEEMEDEELEQIREKYTALAERAKEALKQGQRDVGCPEVESETKSKKSISARAYDTNPD